jgi:hypothetical protein
VHLAVGDLEVEALEDRLAVDAACRLLIFSMVFSLSLLPDAAATAHRCPCTSGRGREFQ